MKRYIKSNRISNLNPIFATHYDTKAAEMLAKSGLFDEETSRKIINQLQDEIHAFVHCPPFLEKYLKGISRMIIENSNGDVSKAQEFISTCPDIFDKYLSYVIDLRNKLGGVEYDNHFINEMSFQDVKDAIKEFPVKYYDELPEPEKDNRISGYTLVPIESYDDFHHLFGGHWTGNGTDTNGTYAGYGGTAWCHANDPSTYHNWTGNTKMFFVLMANNFKNIEFDSESNSRNPKDNYGNSLIALLVDRYGGLEKATLRCNHVGVNSNADKQYQTYRQLSSLAGFDVEKAVKDYMQESKHKYGMYIYKNSKYGMVAADSIRYNETTLYRIQALKDFGDVHNGDLGGYIENLSNLSVEGNCWIYNMAKVYGSANVFENAQVANRAVVGGSAQIYGNSVVSNTATIIGSSHVYDDANVFGNAILVGHCEISDRAMIYGNAYVNNAYVRGSASVNYRVRRGSVIEE